MLPATRQSLPDLNNKIMIRKHLPNFITCLNTFSGCVATVFAFQANYKWAAAFIALAAIFDFLDGLSARTLKAYSNIGKELDSLSDVISFGLAPAAMVFLFLKK
jgi:Phosphatidylserine synthase